MVLSPSLGQFEALNCCDPADHCLGVVNLLGQIITGVSGTEREDLRVQIYGPSGLRKLIRVTLEITHLV